MAVSPPASAILARDSLRPCRDSRRRAGLEHHQHPVRVLDAAGGQKCPTAATGTVVFFGDRRHGEEELRSLDRVSHIADGKMNSHPDLGVAERVLRLGIRARPDHVLTSFVVPREPPGH